MAVPLGILDLTPVPAGATSADAVRNSLDLAGHAERLGYHRHWFAEHHNTPGMACPAPALMIGHAAHVTSRMRLGAGGVMLPNHSPLAVAEAFRLLVAMHGERIDLGIGRAPGTDGLTAYALRRGVGGDDFPAQLGELLAHTGDGMPAGHPLARVRAEPADAPAPPVWILGSSDYGAQAAAAVGVGFAFARHLNPRGAPEMMALYRRSFRPGRRESPRAILTLSAICAPTDEEADHLAWSMALGLIRMRQGAPAPLPTPEEARAQRYTPDEEDQIRRYRRAQVLGAPATVRARIEELVHETGADEVMVMTAVHDHAARVRSYRLLAEAMGTVPEPEGTVAAEA
jgi:luciferase family oxidoreductase group 1